MGLKPSLMISAVFNADLWNTRISCRVDVNEEIALEAADLRKRHAVPMRDAFIAATTKIMNGICLTDDPHIKSMKEIKSRWIM